MPDGAEHRPLPADLAGWWRQSCGATGFVEGRLIPPRYAPHTVDEAVDCREVMLEVASGDDEAIAALVAQPAGSPCTGWLQVWLPMLAEIADALLHGTDVHGSQPEAGDDGTLDWV